MKQYIGISRDHSGSMGSRRQYALKDYNDTINVIRSEAEKYSIDTVVSVVENGIGRPARVNRAIVNSSIYALKPLDVYIADGNSTPLFDSIGDLIEQFESLPDKDDPMVSFLIMVITDGEENSSKRWSAQMIGKEIERLQATDRWSFTFRVPVGYKAKLVKSFGVPADNVIEWELNNQGLEKSSQKTELGLQTYYASRSVGATSSKAFYADLSGVSFQDVKRALVDITQSVSTFNITTSSPQEIRPFVQNLGRVFIKGTVYYQLSKTETVQNHKDIIIFDKESGKYYSGDNARSLLSLPLYVDIKLKPGMSNKYDIFVQSTSVNRKLIPGTRLLILQ